MRRYRLLGSDSAFQICPAVICLAPLETAAVHCRRARDHICPSPCTGHFYAPAAAVAAWTLDAERAGGRLFILLSVT